MYRLLIFSRYPIPGQTKTRLIPALGATGAAAFHRHMATQLLHQARTYREQLQPQTLDIQVWFTGGSPEAMATWFGSDVAYYPQASGDLGDRLWSAMAHNLQIAPGPVVVVGTDCPDLDAQVLAQGFHALETADLVLGPALDGGYYLLGLTQPWPQLFQAIPWSSDRVLSKTLEVANRLNLRIKQLLPLKDCDRPEDLNPDQIAQFQT